MTPDKRQRNLQSNAKKNEVFLFYLTKPILFSLIIMNLNHVTLAGAIRQTRISNEMQAEIYGTNDK